MHHQTTPVRRAARAAAGLALLPALVVAGAAPAAAHDELIRTAPAVDETVTTAPPSSCARSSDPLLRSTSTFAIPVPICERRPPSREARRFGMMGRA